MKKDLYTIINETYNKYLLNGDLTDLIKYSLLLQNKIFKMITKGYKYNHIDSQELESYNLEAIVIILKLIDDRDYNNNPEFNFGKYLNAIHRNRILTLIKKKKPEVIMDSEELLDVIESNNENIEDNTSLDDYIRSIARDDKDYQILSLISKGYEIADIVNITGMKNSTIRMRLIQRYRTSDIYNALKHNNF